jgi:hypothetical protein
MQIHLSLRGCCSLHASPLAPLVYLVKLHVLAISGGHVRVWFFQTHASVLLGLFRLRFLLHRRLNLFNRLSHPNLVHYLPLIYYFLYFFFLLVNHLDCCLLLALHQNYPSLFILLSIQSLSHPTSIFYSNYCFVILLLSCCLGHLDPRCFRVVPYYASFIDELLGREASAWSQLVVVHCDCPSLLHAAWAWYEQAYPWHCRHDLAEQGGCHLVQSHPWLHSRLDDGL